MSGITLLLLLLAFIICGIPVAWSFGLSSALYMLFHGIDLSVFIQRLGSSMDSFTILAIPLFMLAGEIMNSGGITKRIIVFADSMVGHMHAGLGHVNILASLIFSGMSGSAVADTSALGTILIPSMEEKGYSRDYSAAVTAASSTIGPIVPPSIPMIIYGITVGVSITDLFLAGFIPGILMAITLMVMNGILGKSQSVAKSQYFSSSRFIKGMSVGIIPSLLPIIIVGGMVFGYFTATEAAGVAVVYGIILGIIYRQIGIKELFKTLNSVSYKTGTVVIILGFAFLFGWIIALEQIPAEIADFLFGLTTNKVILLAMINIFLVIVGLFLEANAAILILAPVLVSVIEQLGVNPVHFGIIMVLNLMIGLITPPVGACLYMVSEVADIKVERVIVSVLPFIVPLILTLLIVTYVPQIVLFLPNLLH